MEVLMSGNKMRLNEKNVINFASCNSPVDKEGYLSKKAPDASSGHGRGFQRRFFALKGNLLFYFEKKGDREPLGVIIMEGCTVELVEVPDQAYTFGIHFQGNGARTYVLAAEDQEAMESWMKVLACATYEYMRLMVAELQRQLDEINAAERQKTKKLKEAARTRAAAAASVSPDVSRANRAESSLSKTSSENNGLEEDDIFNTASPSLSSASSLGSTPPSRAAAAAVDPNSARGRLMQVTSDYLGSTTVAALRRAPSPSRLNPVGATVVQDISEIGVLSRSSPTSGGATPSEISDMHIVDPHRRSNNASPKPPPRSSPKSFMELHQQFGQPIVQQIQSRKSSSSALSSGSSEEFY